VTLGRSGASLAGAISRRAPRSRVVANTAARWVPKRRKAPRSFGNRRSSRGGGGRGPLAVSLRRGGVSSPPDAKTRRPGCSRERTRRGARPSKGESFSRRPRPALVIVAKVTRPARLALTVVPLRASGEARWATWVRRRRKRAKKEAAASRNSRARIECSKGVPARRVVVAEVGRRRLAQRSVSRVLF